MASNDLKLNDRLFASADASVRFALSCLAPLDSGSIGRLRARSTFVDPRGRIMHWHDFGDLEGPGWAANAIGGADLLYRWGRYADDAEICERALRLVDHVLEDGFVRGDGFIWPYWDLAEERFCLNYAHTDDWLCPGSLALVGLQMLDLADELDRDVRSSALQDAARGLGEWLDRHVPTLANGWVPRRITLEGDPYPLTPEGRPDPIFDHSADGVYLLGLWGRLDMADRAVRLGDVFVEEGGFWGSINHDTYDDHENVAYAVAFRLLLCLSPVLDRPEWEDFAFETALPAMMQFRMDRHRHGVWTRGLYWMERSWDTAYLWENAEVAAAHLDAWLARGESQYKAAALGTLDAIAHHHYGDEGFLTEGVDWNNHVSQRHHIHFDYYGAIRYTEPLLNNLHLVGPTLTYLEAVGFEPPDGDCIRDLPAGDGDRAVGGSKLEAGTRTYLRLFYPTLTDEESIETILSFADRAGMDGVWLFESSYDADPAILTLDDLKGRFERLRVCVPRFRDAGLEVHINVMITMGHVDHGGGRPEMFPFQFLVDEHGHVSRSTACPLDPAFLDYMEQLYRWAAECGADAVWVDDDVRFLIHDVPGMTCFCPHHLREMEKRTDRTWTRATLVAALRSDDTPVAVRNAWFDLQEDAMLGLAERIEREVHVVDPSLPIGLMSVGAEIHNAEGRRTDRLLRALNGPAVRPMLRPGSGFWRDWEPAALLTKTENVAQQIGYLGRDVLTVAEIENHPYSFYQKSHRILGMEMALNILAGTDALSFNVLTGTSPLRPDQLDSRDLAAYLVAQRPFLDALADVRRGKHRVGIGIETSEHVPRQMHLNDRPLHAWVKPHPWEIALARMGFPLGSPYDTPHLLTRDVVHSDRYALGSALQDGAVMTPGAVSGLLSNGWGDRLGVQDAYPIGPAVNEFLTEDPWTGVWASYGLPVRHAAQDLNPHTYDFGDAADVRVLSNWRDLDDRPVGVAMAAVTLQDGRRIGLLPFEIEPVIPALLHPARRDVWAALFEWVGRAALPVRVIEGINVYPQVFVQADNSEAVLALSNLSADEACVRLEAACLARYESITVLSPDGHWQPLTSLDRLTVPGWALSVYRFR